jgi:hypothetical protein
MFLPGYRDVCRHALLIALLASAGLTATVATEPGKGEIPHGKNVALGAKYELSPAPNYALCTDPGDLTQLTDGKTTSDYFWTQQGTVGWTGASYAAVTVDLGREQPISGVSFHTAAGVAGVAWPAAIHVLVSDDGRQYRNVGDLVALDHKRNGPWPEGYAIRRLATAELHTKGRFVSFVVLPLARGSFIFVDEVEVFRGPDKLLGNDSGGEPVGSVAQFVKQVVETGGMQLAVHHRLESDREGIRRAIRLVTSGNAPLRTRLLGRLEKVYQEAEGQAKQIHADHSFRAVLPICPAHAKMFQVQAELWKATGLPELVACAASTWDPIDPFERLSPGPARIQVDTMRGEYRAAALNLANTTSRPLKVRIRTEGLPGSPAPNYLTVHEVQWTDTAQGRPVAAALPEAQRNDGAWTVTVLPGLVRQVWFTFHVADVPSGDYTGTVIAESADAQPRRVPLTLRVWPFDFPKQTTLWLGGWSYTNGAGSYGLTPQNRPQFLKHLQSHFVNAPWATNSVMLPCQFTGDPLVAQLDTKEFDAWIAEWPKARQYMVFLGAGPTLGDAKVGTPSFDRHVAAWLGAWVRHLQGKGIAPERLTVAIQDEPSEGTDISALLAWAKAIRAAEPKVRIWEDPIYLMPQKAPSELFSASDILCPNRPMWLEGSKRFEQFFLAQKRQGRTLNFYSCAGPAKLLDPYSYYRLQAWHCWQIDATGTFFWAFGDNSGSSSWNEYLAAHNSPYTPLFLDDETVVAGKQMEAIRESVEDFEYFVMLRRATDRAKASGRSDAAVAKAESLLQGGAQRVLDAPGAKMLRWRDKKDRTLADDVRREILQSLSQLP